jgi:hypothetical protein
VRVLHGRLGEVGEVLFAVAFEEAPDQLFGCHQFTVAVDRHRATHADVTVHPVLILDLDDGAIARTVPSQGRVVTVRSMGSEFVPGSGFRRSGFRLAQNSSLGRDFGRCRTPSMERPSPNGTGSGPLGRDHSLSGSLIALVAEASSPAVGTSPIRNLIHRMHGASKIQDLRSV